MSIMTPMQFRTPEQNKEYFSNLESSTSLDPDSPVVVRLDGVGFSKWTKKNCTKPFDTVLHDLFIKTLVTIMTHSQCSVIGETHSDEISFILNFGNNSVRELPYGGKIQKLCSIYASVVTEYFNRKSSWPFAYFDCRAFNLKSNEDVLQYLNYRRADCKRNSIQILAQEHFSQSVLSGKSLGDQLILLSEKDIFWNDLNPAMKFGSVVVKELVQLELTEQELKRISKIQHPKDGKVWRHRYSRFVPSSTDKLVLEVNKLMNTSEKL